MRRKSLFFPLLLLSACAGGRTAARPDGGDPRTARLERQVETLRLRLAAPAIAAGVVEDGKLVWSRGFGYADPRRGVRATDRTPFRLASVTKTFTSFLMLQLETEGRLSLADPVTVDTAPTVVEARRVLSQTSDDLSSGTFHYNHERFKTLGPLIASASGVPLRRAVEERILLPFGMNDTAPGEDGGACPPEPDAFDEYMAARDTRVLLSAAQPYRVGKGLRAAPVEDAPGVLSSAGGMISTVRDLAKYAARLDPDFMAPAFTAVKNSSGTDNPYGLGWFVQTVRGEKVVWHYGDVPDLASSLFLLVPGRKLALIVLADTDGLSVPFDEALSSGDATGSPFTDDFLRIFVFEKALDRPLPDPDWTLRPKRLRPWIDRTAAPGYDYAAESRAADALQDWRRRMGAP